jgi:hypothetical protein
VARAAELHSVPRAGARRRAPRAARGGAPARAERVEHDDVLGVGRVVCAQQIAAV